jgi:multidrug resistance efflux pump
VTHHSSRRWIAAGVIVVVLGATAGAWSLYGRYRDVSAVPVIAVTRGVFIDELKLRGDVRPLKTLTVNAPTFASGTGDLRIVKLVKNGTTVRKGEPIVQFDVTMLQRTLEEKRSELRQADAEITRLQGENRIKEEQDRTDLAKAQYDVERAKLDASTEELISRVEAEKFKLALADARQRLAETETRLAADGRGAAADVDSRRQKRDKAALEVANAERDLRALSVVAPGDGTVSIMNNWRAGGAFSNGREFREGDRAWPGAAIAEVPDLSVVEIAANVDESDRGRLDERQAATIRVDALPDRELTGRVASISTLAKVVFEGWPPVKQFEVRLRLTDPDPRLKSGMSAMASVATDRLERQLLLPARAVIQKAGRQVVYVRRGLGWDERGIVTGRRNAESVLVTSGVAEGDRVALRDPSQAPDQGARR